MHKYGSTPGYPESVCTRDQFPAPAEDAIGVRESNHVNHMPMGAKPVALDMPDASGSPDRPL